jgi:thioredoxin 1
MAERIDKESFDEKVIGEKLPVLVEFYSDSCIPCKQMSPILGGIEDDYEGRLLIYKVNANYDAELAGKYDVMSSPTILFFKNGKEIERARGLIKRPELEEIINRIL